MNELVQYTILVPWEDIIAPTHQIADLMGINVSEDMLNDVMEHRGDYTDVTIFKSVSSEKEFILVHCPAYDWIGSLTVRATYNRASEVHNILLLWDNKFRNEYGQKRQEQLTDTILSDNLSFFANKYGISELFED